MRVYLIVLLLAGCAPMEAAKGPETFDVARREPACARQCLHSYSTCVANVANALYESYARTVMTACDANTRRCLETCPATP